MLKNVMLDSGSYGDMTLVHNKDYTYAVTDGGTFSGPAFITVTGINTCYGTARGQFIVGEVETPVRIASIDVTVLPDKMTYDIGEPLDLTGMKVTAAYSDGSAVKIDGYTTTPEEGHILTSRGSQKVLVSYEDGDVLFFDEFYVEVNYSDDPVVFDNTDNIWAVTNNPTNPTVFTVYGDTIIKYM